MRGFINNVSSNFSLTVRFISTRHLAVLSDLHYSKMAGCLLPNQANVTLLVQMDGSHVNVQTVKRNMEHNLRDNLLDIIPVESAYNGSLYPGFTYLT